MEHRSNKIGQGFKLIKQSLMFVIAHPILLVYGVCSFIISHALLMAFRASPYNIESHLDAIANNPDYYKSYETVLLSETYAQYNQYYAAFRMIIIFIMLFFLACLAHHAMNILKKEAHGIAATIKGVVRRFPTLSVWFMFKIIISKFFISFLLPHRVMNTFVFFFWVIVVLIHYLTSLVLPILATEKVGLIPALKRSYRLVMNYWMTFIGIFLVFDLLASVDILVVNICVEHLCILTYTIFYYEYYARPKPELTDIFSHDV